MILGIVAIAVIICIIILCVIILGIVVLGVIVLIMLGVAKLIMLLVVLGISSFTQTYTEQDFADSRWEDSAGTVIELYSDGTCNVRDLKWDLIGWNEDYPKSFVGQWIIETNKYGKQTIIIIMETEEKRGYVAYFTIEDIDTIKETIGDPDECEYYTLTRKR